MNSISRVLDCDSIFQHPWTFQSGCGCSTTTLHEKPETLSIEISFNSVGNSEIESSFSLAPPSTDYVACFTSRSDVIREESSSNISTSLLKSNSSSSLKWELPNSADEFLNQNNCNSSFIQKNDWNSQLIRDDPYLFSAAENSDTELNKSWSVQESKLMELCQTDQDKVSKPFSLSKDSNENEVSLQINSVINLKSLNGCLPGMLIKDSGTNELWGNDVNQSKFMLYEFLEIEETTNSIHCEDTPLRNICADDDCDEVLPKSDNSQIADQPLPVNDKTISSSIDFLNGLPIENDAEKIINFQKYQEYKKKYNICNTKECTNLPFKLRSQKQGNVCNQENKQDEDSLKTPLPRCLPQCEKRVIKRHYSYEANQEQHLNKQFNINNSGVESCVNTVRRLRSAADERKDRRNEVNHYWKHLKSKSLKKLKTFKCTFCEKLFSSEAWFKKHESNHLSDVDKLNSCCTQISELCIFSNSNVEESKDTGGDDKLNKISKLKEAKVVITPLERTFGKVDLSMGFKFSSSDSSWFKESQHSSVRSNNMLNSCIAEAESLPEVHSSELLEVVSNNNVADDLSQNLKATHTSVTDGKSDCQDNKLSASLKFDIIAKNKLDSKHVPRSIKKYNTRSHSKTTISTVTNNKSIKRRYHLTSIKESCVVRSGDSVPDFIHLPENSSEFNQPKNSSVAEGTRYSMGCEEKLNEGCKGSNILKASNKINLESAAVDAFWQPIIKLRRLNPKFLKIEFPKFQQTINKRVQNIDSRKLQICFDVPKSDSQIKNSFPNNVDLPDYNFHKNFRKQSSYSVNFDLDTVYSCKNQRASEFSKLRTVQDVSDTTDANLKCLKFRKGLKYLPNYRQSTSNSDYKKEKPANQTILTRSKLRNLKLNKPEYSLNNSVDFISNEIPETQIHIKTRICSSTAVYMQKSFDRSLTSAASDTSLPSDKLDSCTRKTRLQKQKQKLLHKLHQDHNDLSGSLNLGSNIGNITNDYSNCDNKIPNLNSQIKPILPLYEKVDNLNAQEAMKTKSCGRICRSQCATAKNSLTRKRCKMVNEYPCTSKKVCKSKKDLSNSDILSSSVENPLTKTDAVKLDFNFISSAGTIMKGKNRIETENVLSVSEKENKINSAVIETFTSKKYGNGLKSSGSFHNKERNWREDSSLIKTFKINRRKSITELMSTMQNDNHLKNISNSDDAVNCNPVNSSTAIKNSTNIHNIFGLKCEEFNESNSENLNSEGKKNDKSYFLRFRRKNKDFIASQNQCLNTKSNAYSVWTQNSTSVRSKFSIPNENHSRLGSECVVEFSDDSYFSCKVNHESGTLQHKMNLDYSTKGMPKANFEQLNNSNLIHSKNQQRCKQELDSCDISVKKSKIRNSDNLRTVNGLVIFDKTPVVEIERLNL